MVSDDDMEAALEGCAFAVCTAEFYRVNRVARRTGLRWTASHSSATEVVLGPTVYPGETACYVCYQMRSVACSDDPAAELAALRRREPTQECPTGVAGLLGQMLALEAVNRSAKGAIVVVDAVTLCSQRHAVLRVPACPICSIS